VMANLIAALSPPSQAVSPHAFRDA
jgi:hypothetical protein